jgi:hypothetical protein
MYRSTLAAVVGIAAVITLTAAPMASPASATVKVCHRDTSFEPPRLSGFVTVTITTIPPQPKASFILDGKPMQGSSKGTFTAQTACSIRRHTLTLANPKIGNHERFQFDRWSGPVGHDYINQPDVRRMAIVSDVHLQAGFRVSYVIHFRYVDPGGQPFDERRVNSMTIKSTSGNRNQQRITGHTIRLSGISIRQAGFVLVASPIVQQIESVEIDDSNAVFAGRQKFSPSLLWHKHHKLKVRVSIFALHISAHSRIFGSPVNGTVVLTYPDGARALIAMNRQSVTLTELVRGDYKVSVVSPGGSPIARPLRLSDNTYIDLAVITRTDKLIAELVLVVILLVAISLRMSFRRRHNRHLGEERSS